MFSVLFLDIDGVILSFDELHRTGDRRLLPEDKLAMIRDVCSRTGAVVVVSSTWRFSDETRDLLIHKGLPLHDDWRTPIYTELVGSIIIGQTRGQEIAQWLSAHPEIIKYAIIDDDRDMMPDQLPRFVKTNGHLGVTQSDADQLQRLLQVA